VGCAFSLGAVVTAVVAPIITARSVRASDKRKADQEKAMQDRKDEREDKMREQENLYTVATEYVEVCSSILTDAIDTKGIFNMFRDMFYNKTGEADPMAALKFDRAEKVVESNKRIAMPFNKLRLAAPTNVLDAASRLNAAIVTVMKQTTEPFAAQVAMKTSGEELENFINVFRRELGREEYTESDAQKQVLTFMENLKGQVEAYMREAKADMKAAGFKTTPWDNTTGQTPTK